MIEKHCLIELSNLCSKINPKYQSNLLRNIQSNKLCQTAYLKSYRKDFKKLNLLNIFMETIKNNIKNTRNISKPVINNIDNYKPINTEFNKKKTRPNNNQNNLFKMDKTNVKNTVDTNKNRLKQPEQNNLFDSNFIKNTQHSCFNSYTKFQNYNICNCKEPIFFGICLQLLHPT